MLSIKLPVYNQAGAQPALIGLPLIGVSEVQVLGAEMNEQGELIIEVESTVKGTPCHKCQQEAHKGHGHDQPRLVRHLPVFGRKTYLRFRPKRFGCAHCPGEPTSTQQVDWCLPRSPQTKAFETHLLWQLVNSTVEDVSHKEGVSYDEVLGIIDRHLGMEVDWSHFEHLGVLGLDEIALKKGHQDYVVIVTTRLPEGQVKLLAVLPDRKKKTLVKFLRSIPPHLRRTIHTVCTDMWEAYRQAVKRVLSGAQVVVDRFHVAQKYYQAADKLRQKELKRLKQELPKTDYQQLKGAMWAFRKKPADLSEAETAALAHLLEYSPLLRVAYDLRQKLTAIFDQELTKTEAIQHLKAWGQDVQQTGLTCFDSFLTTLHNHLDEITNYFINRLNSGFVEGLNNKIKVLKRRCYGLLNLAVTTKPPRRRA
ncbi:MAG: ISL3 family transposase [Pseudomonadota bacterium]